jgi:chromosome segregation ATPase
MNTSSLDSALLAQIQERIAQALADLDVRSQALPAAAAATNALRERLQHARARLLGMQTHTRKAADRLQEMDAQLATEEDIVRPFLSEAAALRQRLAIWTGRAIG